MAGKGKSGKSATRTHSRGTHRTVAVRRAPRTPTERPAVPPIPPHGQKNKQIHRALQSPQHCTHRLVTDRGSVAGRISRPGIVVACLKLVDSVLTRRRHVGSSQQRVQMHGVLLDCPGRSISSSVMVLSCPRCPTLQRGRVHSASSTIRRIHAALLTRSPRRWSPTLELDLRLWSSVVVVRGG